MASTKLYDGRVIITFNEMRHTYSIRIPELKIEKLWQPSVTGLLNVMAKDALIPWAAGEVRLYAEEKLHEQFGTTEDNELTVRDVENILAEAQECWRDRSKAMSIGSLAHRYLHSEIMYRAGATKEKPEMTVKADPILAPSFDQTMIDAAALSVKAGIQFLDEHHVESIMFERVMFSPEHGFVGTADLVAKVDGVLSVIDYKTSKAIYPSMFLQLAAYQSAFMCEFPDKIIKNRYVVNIKKDGTGLEYEMKDLDTYSEDLDAFLSCLTLYRWNRANDKYRPGSPIQVIGTDWLKNKV